MANRPTPAEVVNNNRTAENARKKASATSADNAAALEKKRSTVNKAVNNLRDDYHAWTVNQERLTQEQKTYNGYFNLYPPNGPQEHGTRMPHEATDYPLFVASANNILTLTEYVRVSHAKAIASEKAYVAAYTSSYNNNAYVNELKKYNLYSQEGWNNAVKPTKSTVSSGGKTGTSSTTPSALKTKDDSKYTTYKFNAPMVKDSYFNTNSLTSSVVDNDAFFDPRVQDGVNSWAKGLLGKGLMQMSRED